MEFNEKLQELRKQNEMTQEELAEVLFVSRTAISKWESGRGYPSIDSLKEISRFFQVSIDDLLSSEEMLTVAQEDASKKLQHSRDIVFGLLDCSLAMYFFLPFFGQKLDGVIQEVSLISLTEYPIYLKLPYIIIVSLIVLCGIATLAFQNCSLSFWCKNKAKLSLSLSVGGTAIFMISLQPYAAMFTFIFLLIKTLMLIKWA